MGSLDLGDLASASQDQSTSRLTLTPTSRTFSSYKFLLSNRLSNVYIWWVKLGQIVLDSPNSPKFSSATISTSYTVAS